MGLEFWVRFRRPIFTDETIFLEWMVVKVTPNEKLRGEIVELRGRIKGQDGKTSLGAKGRVLVTDRLQRGKSALMTSIHTAPRYGESALFTIDI